MDIALAGKMLAFRNKWVPDNASFDEFTRDLTELLEETQRDAIAHVSIQEVVSAQVEKELEKVRQKERT